MAELVSRETGKIEDVPDDQVQALYQSGRYGFVKGSTVSVQDDSGAIKQVPSSEAGKAFGAGHTFVGPDEIAKREQEEKYGGLGGGLAAGAAGVARGLTFGLSDPVLLAGARLGGGKEAKESLREKLEGYKEANPITSVGSELAGAVLPSLFTGGAGEAAVAGREGLALAKEGATVAKVAGTAEEAATLAKEGSTVGKAAKTALSASPAKLSSLGADAAEKAVAAVIGDASENTLARVLQKGVAKGAGGFIEGGLYGVGDQISEDTLGDHDITGEKLAAAFGHGGFYGSLVGGGLGAGGEALSSGARWALTKASPAAKKAAEDMAVRSLSYGGLAPKAYMNALERIPGGAKAVGRELLDKDLIRAGDSFETIAPRLRAAADDAGDALSTGRKALDTAGVEGPKVDTIAKRVADQMEEKFGALKSTHAGAFTKAESILGDMRVRFGGEAGVQELGQKTTFEGLADFRKAIDNDIRWSATAPGAPMNANQEALKIVRGVVEDELEKATDAASSKMGADTLKEYQTAKLSYRRLTSAADLAEDSVTRAQKNQLLGVSDKLIAGTGLLHGLATGNPLTAVAGLGLSALHHAAMDRGPATAASVLNKVADLAAIRKSVEAVDGRMVRGLDGFLEKKTPEHAPKVFKTGAAREEAYDAATKRVRVASVNPEESAGHIQKALQGAVTAAPKISRVAITTAGRTAVFLAAKLPSSQSAKTITPQFDVQQKPSAFEQDKFLRYVRAADDPMSVLDDMQNGRLTKEGVETIRECYPRLFEDLQKKAIEKCADAKHPMDYNQKIQLGLLLGVPTDATLEPAFMRRMQEVHAGDAGKSGPPKMHGPPKRPLADVGTSMQLGQQRSDR